MGLCASGAYSRIQLKKGQPMDLSKEQIFLALASEVPDGDKLVANPNKKWSDIDKSLPDTAITIYGPPPTSGTRDAFVELAMHKGCGGLDYFKKQKSELDKKAYKNLIKEKCTPMRQDGPFIEAGENDNLIVQRIEDTEDIQPLLVLIIRDTSIKEGVEKVILVGLITAILKSVVLKKNWKTVLIVTIIYVIF